MSMTQAERDAAKRAAAGESLGAFVTIDINRLDKSELIMLGSKLMLDKYLQLVERGRQNAVLSGNAALLTAIMQLQMLMREEHEAITLELTKSAQRNRAATLQEIPKEPH